MKRVIEAEIEYVSLVDVQELMSIAKKVGEKGHYARVTYTCGGGNEISVAVEVGGLTAKREYDLLEYFDLGDGTDDVEAMNRAKEFLYCLKNATKAEVPNETL